MVCGSWELARSFLSARLKMHPVDWVVVVAFTAWIVYDGLKRTKDSDELEGYFLAKRSIPWWAAGISVMAAEP